MVKHIFVLFVGRTGSTFLMQIFKTLYNSSVMCNYGEIFTTIEAIMETFNAKEKLGISSENYRSYALNNPMEYIDFIESNVDPNTEFLFSKIQIPYLMSKHEDMIKKILSRKNCELVIVKRNILDSFISEKKARYVNRWNTTDTTNLRINIDPKEFFENYCKTVGYYKRLEDIIEKMGKKYIVLNYEKIHKLKNNNEKIDFVLKNLKMLQICNDIDDTKFDEKELLKRQDKNDKNCNKISNYKSLQGYLIKMGLFKILD